MALVKIKYCKFFKIIFSFKKVNSLYLLIQAIYIDYFVGWAGKIRTCACQSQSLVPYRLATAQYKFTFPFLIGDFLSISPI